MKHIAKKQIKIQKILTCRSCLTAGHKTKTMKCLQTGFDLQKQNSGDISLIHLSLVLISDSETGHRCSVA